LHDLEFHFSPSAPLPSSVAVTKFTLFRHSGSGLPMLPVGRQTSLVVAHSTVNGARIRDSYLIDYFIIS